MKKLIISAVIFFILNFKLCSAQVNFGVYSFEENTINAKNNAVYHNNLGNIYFSEKNYIAAIKEYELAFNLAPDNNLCATYLYNLARCYMALNRFQLAQNALLGAIKTDCMNLVYYEALVDCFINLNTQNYELSNYLNDSTNPYNKIIVGLIYLKTNNKKSAKTTFNKFVKNYPDFLITEDIKKLIEKI